MDTSVLNLGTLPPYAAFRIRRIFFGPVGILLEIPAALLLATEAYRGHPLALLGILTLGWVLFVIALFARALERMGNTRLPIAPEFIPILAHKTRPTLGHLLAQSLATPSGMFIAEEMGTNARSILHQTLTEAGTVPAPEFLEEARASLERLGEQAVTSAVVLAHAFQRKGSFTDLLNTLDLSPEDVDAIARFERLHRDVLPGHLKLFDAHTFVRLFGEIGKTWSLGFTWVLDRFTTDITDEVLRENDTVNAHPDETEHAISVLSRAQDRNLLVIGRPGAGKRAFVKHLVRAMRVREISRSLPISRILVLQSAALVAGTGSPDAALLQALSEAERAGNFLVVIPEIADLLAAKNEQVHTVLHRFLHSRMVTVVALATPDEYHGSIRNDPRAAQSFETMFLEEASDALTLRVLMEEYVKSEGRSRMKMTYKTLRLVQTLTQRYVGSLAQPGNAVATLRDALALARNEGAEAVTAEYVRRVVAQKSHVDLRELSTSDASRLLKLEEVIERKIIGQDMAVRSVVNALKRGRTSLAGSKRPIGTFLFLGPTGVGKTQTANVIAEEYFGSVDRMIRLDMNEFSTEESAVGIIGAIDGAREAMFVKRVQDRPFSLILLDEIEKAHPSVLHLFLQVLDEGRMSSPGGMTTDFRSTVIIATSNAGSLFVRNTLATNASPDPRTFKDDLIEHVISEKIFSPEFINRFDDVVVFRPLSSDDAKRVAILMIDGIVRDMKERRGIDLVLTEGVLSAIVERGYSSEFGAREMRRAITEILENAVANALLKTDVKRGGRIELTDL